MLFNLLKTGLLFLTCALLIPQNTLADETGHRNANILYNIFYNWIHQPDYSKFAIVGNTKEDGSGSECHVNVAKSGARITVYELDNEEQTAVFSTSEIVKGTQNVGQVCRDYIVKLGSTYESYSAEIMINYTSNLVSITQNGKTVSCHVDRRSYDFQKEASGSE